MDKKLTKEEYESLKPYEKNLKAAYKHSYVHMTGEDFSKVAVLYAEIMGEALTKSQMGCNTCRLNALRKLGELYDNYEKKLEAKETKKRPKKLDKENGEEQ